MPIKTNIARVIYDTRAFAKRKVYRKVTIGGTDVSSHVVSSHVDLGSTNRVGSFSVLLDNGNGRYTDTFSKNSVVQIWINYDNVFTGDPMIEGRLEVPEYIMENNGALYLQISGRDYMCEADRLVFEDFSATPTSTSEVIKYLRDKYASGHSSSNTYIDTIQTNITPSWNGRPLLQAIRDCIQESGGNHTFRIDSNKVWHIRQKGTVVSGLGIIYQGNMISGNNIDGDLQSMKNRTWVVGSSELGNILIHRDDDSTSQSSYNIRETMVEDTNLINYDQVSNKSSNLNSVSSTMEQKGSCQSYGLPTLVPGEEILLINPFLKLNEFKTVVDVSHSLDASGFITSISYQEQEKGIMEMIIESKKTEQERIQNKNLHGMTRTHYITFNDTDYGESGDDPNDDAQLDSLTKTLVWDNTLMLQLNESSGEAQTKTLSEDAEITHVLLKVTGNNFKSDEGETWFRCEITTDGSNYVDVEPDTLVEIPSSKRGKVIIAKFHFASLTTKLTSASILYKKQGQ